MKKNAVSSPRGTCLTYGGVISLHQSEARCRLSILATSYAERAETAAPEMLQLAYFQGSPRYAFLVFMLIGRVMTIQVLALGRRAIVLTDFPLKVSQIKRRRPSDDYKR